MVLPDVNICLAAFRADHAEHVRCRQWLTTVYANEPAVAMSPLVLAAVVRITTQHRFNSGTPSRLEDALGFCKALLTHPTTVIIHPGSNHWDIFEKCAPQANAAGKLAADAFHAALAIEHGCTWVSMDADFSKFSGLRWQRF